jgi:RNA polymerase sigma-70 factor (ECF subfamily)
LILLEYNTYKNLFKELYEPLCNLAFSILNDFDGSEDVVQEVFVNLWQNKEKLEIRTNINNYLFTAVRNKSIEKLRRLKIEEKYIQFEKERTIYSEEIDDEEIDKYKKIAKLYKSIDSLPTKCQKIFKMSKIDGMTYVEISEELRLSVKTIESQMRRAFLLLRDMLKDV